MAGLAFPTLFGERSVIYDDILGTIGNTPVVRVNRIAPAGRTIYVKIEFFNPAGSVKDRWRSR